jgi:hypothetical protein
MVSKDEAGDRSHVWEARRLYETHGKTLELEVMK